MCNTSRFRVRSFCNMDFVVWSRWYTKIKANICMPLIHRCEGYASRLEMTFSIKKKLKVETVLKHFIREPISPWFLPVRSRKGISFTVRALFCLQSHFINWWISKDFKISEIPRFFFFTSRMYKVVFVNVLLKMWKYRYISQLSLKHQRLKYLPFCFTTWAKTVFANLHLKMWKY